MPKLAQIQDFLTPKKMAIAGVSRDEKKFGYQIYHDLTEKGFEIFPINPNADNIKGSKCYRNVSELPDDVKHLLIITPKEQTEAIVSEGISKGIKNMWIQQMSETKESIALAEKNGINVITHYCIYMFTEPVKGFHRFHRGLTKLFGKYPSKN
jgi:predicted CoA-binding protein